MATPKRYFHDRVVLLLLAASAFLVVLGTILVLLKLDTDRSGSYIVQCRDCTNAAAISKFTSGTVAEILAFIVFLFIVSLFHFMLSLRVYPLRRHAAMAILGLGVLLLTLAVVVSNALLVLR